MQINIGLYNSNPGWEILLEQEGVQYEIIKPGISGIEPGKFVCLIIHANSLVQDHEEIKDHIKSGGLVLFESKIYAEIFNRKCKRKKVRSIFPARGTIFTSQGVVDFNSELNFVKYNSTNFLDKELKIIWDIIGNGAIAVIPFDVNRLLTDFRFCRKRFPADRKELPSELVSSVSKGKIRRIISILLKKMLTFKKLPYIQKWYYNSEARSCFIFRVDTDFCDEDSACKLHEIFKEYDINATWFIDTASERMVNDIYKKMEDQEIAFHCDRHRIFKDQDKNYH